MAVGSWARGPPAVSPAAALAVGTIGYATREDLVALERGRHAPAAAERLFRALVGAKGRGA